MQAERKTSLKKSVKRRPGISFIGDKMLEWIKSGLQYVKRDIKCSQMPVRVWIEPTNHCNFNCVMCPHKDVPNESRGYMSMDTFKEAIRQCSAFKPSINLFLSGEPFLHPNLPEMIEYIHNHDMKVRIETNGGISRPDVVEAQPDVLSFSYDGYEPKVYSENHVGGNFYKTMENIKTMLAYKVGDKPFVYLTAINLPNVKNTPKGIKKEFMDSFEDTPIDVFRTVEPHNFGGKVSPIGRYKDGFLKYKPCPLLWAGLVVRWNGDIVPCCMDFTGINKLGNITDMTLEEAWNSQKMQNFRKAHKESKQKPIPLCGSCTYPYTKTPITDMLNMLKEEINI